MRRVVWVDIRQGFERQVGLGVDQDLAFSVDDEGVAVTIEVERVDQIADGLQVGVHAADANQPAPLLHRSCQGDDQLAGRSRNVRFGHDGLAGCAGCLVPAACTRIIVGGAVADRHRLHAAVLAAEIGELEIAGVYRQCQASVEAGLARPIDGNLLGQRDQQLLAAVEPGADVACGEAAEVLQVGLCIAAQGLALAVVVEQHETGKGDGHHQGGGQQDLVAELEILGHFFVVCTRQGGGGLRSRVTA
ncbi:hypothetical protein D3C81_1216010 [compost metagenome]